MTLTSAQELDYLMSRDAPRLASALLALAGAHMLMEREGTGPALAALAGYLTDLLAMGDLLGRRRVLLVARNRGASTALVGGGGPEAPADVGALFLPPAPPAAPPPSLPAAPPGPLWPGGGRGVPKVDFPEAVGNLTLREPRLLATVPGDGPVAVRMGRLYAQDGFSLARSADVEVIAKVQSVLGRSMKGVTTASEATEAIAEMGDWSRAYANTVFRTNLSTAYTAGTFEQMKDPAVLEVIGALELHDVGDSDTRPSHHEMSGTLAPANHPIWNLRSPPLDYNCRCSVIMRDWAWLRRNGHVKNGAVVPVIPNQSTRAAPGFGHRRGLALSA